MRLRDKQMVECPEEARVICRVERGGYGVTDRLW